LTTRQQQITIKTYFVSWTINTDSRKHVRVPKALSLMWAVESVLVKVEMKAVVGRARRSTE
jgi:hypothetical protein